MPDGNQSRLCVGTTSATLANEPRGSRLSKLPTVGDVRAIDAADTPDVTADTAGWTGLTSGEARGRPGDNVAASAQLADFLGTGSRTERIPFNISPTLRVGDVHLDPMPVRPRLARHVDMP